MKKGSAFAAIWCLIAISTNCLADSPTTDKPVAGQYPRKMYGATCSEFVSGVSEFNSSTYMLHKMYIFGYITASNLRLKYGGSVLGDTDIDDFILEVKNYCSSKPFDSVSDALQASILKIDWTIWSGHKYSEIDALAKCDAGLDLSGSTTIPADEFKSYADKKSRCHEQLRILLSPPSADVTK